MLPSSAGTLQHVLHKVAVNKHYIQKGGGNYARAKTTPENE